MQDRQYLERPDKEAMRALPRFVGLPMRQIHVVQNAGDLNLARRQIINAPHVGFDTERKPSFSPGQHSTGPHVVQVATPDHVFLFAPQQTACAELLAELIQSEKIIKAGFGLKSDRGPLFRTFGVHLRAAVELSAAVKRLGYRQQVGIQAAVAIVLGQYLTKPKHLSTSNWAAYPLSPAQTLYAANDALASLRVYLELLKTAPHLLVST